MRSIKLKRIKGLWWSTITSKQLEKLSFNVKTWEPLQIDQGKFGHEHYIPKVCTINTLVSLYTFKTHKIHFKRNPALFIHFRILYRGQNICQGVEQREIINLHVSSFLAI